MKRLVAIAVCALVCVASLSLAAAPAAAQGRGRVESRTLTGRVLGSHDEPLQKAVVYLKNTKSLVIKTYITDADGSYRFPALSTNVDYEVYAEHDGARSGAKTLSGFDSRKDPNITLRIQDK
jgi:hypothetical protein